MCRPTRCKTCGRTTWTGCGQHVGQVRATVPADDWCAGRHTRAEKDAAAAASSTVSWLGWLLRR